MKTLNLFLKMHFTSLSPDGQCVSLAIVSEKLEFGNVEAVFYAEFSDFDINRCDNWVKENVISKLNLGDKYSSAHDSIIDCSISKKVYVNNDTHHIKNILALWINKFSDYKLNFVVDCGWFTWYKFVELMGEWSIQKEEVTSMLANPMYDSPLKAHAKDVLIYQKAKGRELITETDQNGLSLYIANKSGLPKLPANFPPVPIDLNDLIMERKGFKSVTDAFNVDREELAYGHELSYDQKFNALFDAKVTKTIYEKLK